ncbi:hypothetical protein ADUPG1_009083 [Aduncisulcus paluster]|uniref:Uncharacterized protein n=1 Tax=Aduncisulcus paluster TaxID=2918883 RepID=A0ABQ5KUB0_9EUKA|nr:hypothetical protein ADUPG1_009083 [Aduncisulcus paluster]
MQEIVLPIPLLKCLYDEELCDFLRSIDETIIKEFSNGRLITGFHRSYDSKKQFIGHLNVSISRKEELEALHALCDYYPDLMISKDVMWEERDEIQILYKPRDSFSFLKSFQRVCQFFPRVVLTQSGFFVEKEKYRYAPLETICSPEFHGFYSTSEAKFAYGS